MQAYKLKGKVDDAGNLVITESVKMPPGDVEVVVWQAIETVNNDTEPKNEAQPEIPKKKVEYRTKAFRDLLENAPPVPPDFDPEQAKWEYLKEKHNL
ncbi:hypothetical protein H6S82_08915 [Planktothrix sp. FACHB-1355]|uniref:Uncharacterized protein n=1 Tax=Aerosakkonema funiforme FACHB-1375 TaxID=2949571 RepID=A0A926VBA5_9CYAN|nr:MULTISPECIES: hypothetical protein [Oscillatoriales]MBD2180662.1 hypothetical protein [Aerosakkonema funiforme FACHB-1375]MBD3558976.1 hypothetical protein [Planktothrix sp. FACHB-1355]